MRIVVAPDKFRGTLSAAEAAGALAQPFLDAGHHVDTFPLSDGGEGLVHALGGSNRSTTVSGPLGAPTDAAWRLKGTDAVMEMSSAAGLELAGGAEENDPVSATTAGVGQLVTAAIESGATDIFLGMGGSATTDGGLGAIREINVARLKGVNLVVGYDSEVRFAEAPRRFGPQKGATGVQIELLERRLAVLAEQYLEDFGVDVSAAVGAGAAGGLAGGLLAIGARLVSGFEEVSERLDLYSEIESSDLVVTGEGLLDDESFAGKAVGGVAGLAREAGVPALIVAGDAVALDRHNDLVDYPTILSMREHCGSHRSWTQPRDCVAEVLADWLRGQADRAV